jgi:negative regulator of sigma E activity
MGSANAYSTSVHGHVITAIGEVPAATVREIANSVMPVQGSEVPADSPAGAAR